MDPRDRHTVTPPALTLAVCPHFEPEVRAAVAQMAEPVQVVTFEAECVGGPAGAGTLGALPPHGAALDILGGACMSKLLTEQVEAVHLHCFGGGGYPLVNRAVAEDLVARGAYLLSPGWARRWLDYLAAQGFDRATAREYFREFCTHIVLLDAGVDPGANESLQALGSYLDLPVHSLPCGLDYLTLFLTALVHERGVSAAPTVDDPQSAESRLRAEQALTLDALGRFADVADEDAAEEGLLDLFTLLFSPRRLRLVSLRDDGSYRLRSRPPAPEDEEAAVVERLSAISATCDVGDDVFALRMGDEAPRAVIQASAFAFPERTAEYAGFAATLAGAFNLVLANARSFARLQETRDELRTSTERYQMLMEQAGDAIILFNEHGVLEEANAAAAELFDRPLEEMIGRQFAGIFPPAVHARIERRLARLEVTGTASVAGIELESHGERRVIDANFALVDTPGRRIVQGILRDVTDRESAQRHLARLSHTDEMTGLANRRGFIEAATRALATAERLGHHCLLLFADVDGLKQVNDTCGHAEGDALIRAAASVLRASVRESDILGRIGGDEFAVLQVNANAREVPSILERITQAERAASAAAPGVRVSLTVGHAEFDPEAKVPLQSLLSQADAHMYEAKRRRAGSRRNAGVDAGSDATG